MKFPILKETMQKKERKVVSALMPETINGEEYLSTAEACLYLHVSAPWFRSTIVPRYKLKPMKRGVGRTLYYRKADLDPILQLRPAEDTETK